jgi:hypothetical protein
MKPISTFLFVLFAGYCFGQTTIDSGLVAFYPFCGDATDHSGDNNGSVFGGVTFVEDRLGNPNSAAHFEGANGYIRVPASVSLDTLTDNMTLACWFYTKSYDSKWASLLSKSITTYALRQYSIIYDKYGFISFGHTSAGYHHGMIDDVRIYNRALSYEEVIEISSHNFDCNTLAINEPGNHRNIKLYPNPTEGMLTIESKEMPGNWTVKVFDALGKLVQTGKLENKNGTIDLMELHPGMYFLKMETEEGTITKKIIKM